MNNNNSKINISNHLNTVLADTYAVYMRTQYTHWNITGPQFYSIHKLTEQQYASLAIAIDEIAEHIRTFDVEVASGFMHYQNQTSIKHGSTLSIKQPNEMLITLIHDHKMIITTIDKSIKISQSYQDFASEDLLIHRLKSHKKDLWMLSSSLKI